MQNSYYILGVAQEKRIFSTIDSALSLSYVNVTALTLR